VGDLVGRYVLLERIGAGGMGVVHRAYDPELDRHVALKLLRAGTRAGAPESARLRLLREAQALAKLSHDHVVAVFDVGSTTDEVFMAMALVDGIDLLSRLRGAKGAEPPSWREAVRILSAAGAGLAAAHDLGLVHRDFKPGNVLLARDGGVLVTDFGLARVDERWEAHGESTPTGPFASAATSDTSRPSTTGKFTTAPRPATSGSAWLEVDLTVEGAVMGTPGYMAPEQHRGVAADARADQYAFTTTLWECIYGARPFAQVPVDELAVRKAAGPPACPPRPRVPPWLRRVLQRGLAADPAARFPDMHALLSAMEDGPRRRRRGVLAGAAAIATLGVVAFVVRSGVREDPCPPEDGATDAAIVSWNGTREAIADVTIVARLDDVLARRSAALREACRATFVLGERSRQWFVERERCADRQSALLEAALARLRTRDAHTLRNATVMLDAIPAIDDCDDSALDAAELAALAEAETALATGAVAAALARLAELPSGLEHDASIEADALRGRASWALGDPRNAEERLLATVARARGAGRARLEARLWALLGRLSIELNRLDRAALLLDLAVAAAPSEPGDALAGELARTQGALALARGDRVTACERFSSAASFLVHAYGDAHGTVHDAEDGRARACTPVANPATQ